ncbi:DNA gyrase subunit B [Thermosporothrix hazakensis]|jgi:DNA gyrase subunit B|uniref:DNA topoisomerase (ATP-hydrolyzing) n=2 Tax=Thermosporothrix TaxID=768650 RepID=A0A326UBJ0_THEHA|nr:toprim domain-containing protein [Thermosporothrix hazakensis]PZW30671.1 DNA gyrase subunit B [Thermosporothrix hazakensis]BBH91387.1 DNA gyrase subunit B [Thermosporothrix sp. COM3]GCE49533.1 DNA gyrase subunit B [Thermosporothrix hazakensis]
MSRSPKALPPAQDEVGATQEQFSFLVAQSPTEQNGEASSETAKASRSEKKGSNYTSADIQVLEGIAAIRHRPGMYIGSTSTSGLLHLIWEALDNAVDEAVAGYGKHIWLSLDRDGWVTVRDEGRGLPFDPMLYQGEYLPAATVILTVPHSGGKFSEGVYKTAGGLHGVGTTVINALSERLELTIWQEGQQFTQTFSRGTALPHHIGPCDPSLHGTQFRWLYDRSVFDPDAYYSLEAIISRLKASAYLNRGVSFHLDAWDEASGEQVQQVFYSREGLPDYVRDLSEGTSDPLFKYVIGIAKEKDDVSVEVALQPTSGYKIALYSYANAVRTRDGGVHETGFKAALTKVVNDYALKFGVIKNREKDGFRPEVIQQGLNAVISVKLVNPQFQGQTKDRLNNAPVEGIVRSVVDEGLKEWFEHHQGPGKEWLKKIQQMQKARNEALLVEELARAGNKKNGEMMDTSLSKKFLRCNTNDPSRAELFIVEGDSAGGSAGQGRFSDFQAVLKLKGKPLNVAKADLKSIVENDEIRTIINVLGTGTRDTFDITRLKFNRVIIATDADVDGLHIQCLLLTLFHQEFSDLIERGHVYIACPPLYSVKYRGKVIWLLNDESREEFLRTHPDARNMEFKRFKGLGEMNAKELRETMFDPARRVLKRVTMEDGVLASKLVAELMEDRNAERRRVFLAEHSRKVKELDV